MPMIPMTVLVRGLALIGTLAMAPGASQAQTIEDRLQAIGEELREAQTSSPGDTVTSGETASGISTDINLPFEAYAKSMPLPEGSEKIAVNLLQLADGHRTKSAFGLAERAEDLGVPYFGGQAGVRIFADSETDVPALRKRIERQGGRVLTTFRNVVYADLPLDGIKSFGNVQELHFMDAEPMYYAARPNPEGGYGKRVSEGVGLSQVQRLHQAGITGKQVKVGILDFGFERYEDLVRAGEVPKAQAARTFNRAQQLETNGVHGTACAEVIADMAPEAELYLAVMDGREYQIIAAARWLAQQGVDIINLSGAGHNGPHNGRGILDRLVADVVGRYDVLWVNSAGNEGDKHWTQLAQDRNRNQMIDNIAGHSDLLTLKTTGRPFKVTVVWDDWGPDAIRPASSQDIDAYLLRRTAAGKLLPFRDSRQVQNGRGKPLEEINVRGLPAGTELRLALRLKRVRRPVRTHVFVQGGVQLSPVVPQYSVGIPATAPAALAVGAVDVLRDRLQKFSSQGPTDDHRQKPEVSAPDNTVSLAYAAGTGRFPGTSAAAPHVAGLAALIKQMQPQASAGELRQAILSHVTPKGGRTPNLQYGHGRIDAGNIALPQPDPPPQEGKDDVEELERILREILRNKR